MQSDASCNARLIFMIELRPAIGLALKFSTNQNGNILIIEKKGMTFDHNPTYIYFPLLTIISASLGFISRKYLIKSSLTIA